MAELEDYGFEKVGNWVASNHASTEHLKEQVPTGINFVVGEDWRNRRDVCYAFVFDGVPRYLGETTAGMLSRFVSYRYGNPNEIDTDNRVKLAITECLLAGGEVAIWGTQPTADLTLPTGSRLTIPASKPLEEHLIQHLAPDLNVKNLQRG